MASSIVACAPKPTEKPSEALPTEKVPAHAPVPTPEVQPDKTTTPLPSTPLPPSKTAEVLILPLAEEVSPLDQSSSVETPEVWEHFLDGQSVQSIAVDQDCLWLGTDQGIICLSKEGEKLNTYDEAQGLLGRDVQVLKLYRGQLWIGTTDGGLSCFDGGKFTTYGKEEGLEDTRVMAIDIDDDSVWLGLCTGLARLDKKSGGIQYWERSGGFGPEVGSGSGEGATGERRIYADSILIGRDCVWHGAWNLERSDLALRDNRNFACETLPESRVTALACDEKFIYAGTISGMTRIQRDTLEPKPLENDFKASIAAMARDGNYLWIVSDLGVTKLNMTAGDLVSFDFGGGLPFALDIGAKYVWVGTQDGLFRMDKTASPSSGRAMMISGGKWHAEAHPGEAKIYFFKDTKTSALGTEPSLCMECHVPVESLEIPHYYYSIGFSVADMDLIECEGVTFCIKGENLWDEVWFEFNLYEGSGKHSEERWGWHPHGGEFSIPEKWVRVVVPFTTFTTIQKSEVANRILDLAKLNFLRIGICVNKWQGGEVFKVWLDDVRFYQPGEFGETVADQGTPVLRGEEQALSIEDLPIKEELSPQEAEHYVQLGGNKVQCRLCPNQCLLEEGERGICRARQNIEGKLYTLTYGQPCSLAIDPVEKGPIFHMTPGAKGLVVAATGCNLNCKYCQNWQFALVNPEETRNYDLPPETAVRLALDSGCDAIIFTYTEATVFYEYMRDIAKLAKENGLKTVLITSGYINPQPLRDLCPYLDAVKVDLKGFTSEFYQEVCAGELEPVLDTLQVLREEGKWFEVVNLVVPTLNDDLNTISEMCQWIRDNLGTDVPLHFSRFWPSYKLSRLSGTPVSTIEQAIQTAKDAGLKYVYIGNVPGHDAGNTYCPPCGECVIRRVGYAAVTENNIVDGKCKFCGHEIPGIWK